MSATDPGCGSEATDSRYAALIAAAKALVAAEHVSKDAEDALRRTHRACDPAQPATHSDCVRAEIVFEREYRAVVAARQRVLYEACKVVEEA